MVKSGKSSAEETSKTWFYNLPAAKATQFQGNRHLIVGASYLIQELGQKEVNYNFHWKFDFFLFFFSWNFELFFFFEFLNFFLIFQKIKE